MTRPSAALVARVEEVEARLLAARLGLPPSAKRKRSGFFLARIRYPKGKRARAPSQADAWTPSRTLTEAEARIKMRLEMAAIRARTPAGAAAARIAEMGRRLRVAEDREWTAQARAFFESLGCKSKRSTWR